MANIIENNIPTKPTIKEEEIIIIDYKYDLRDLILENPDVDLSKYDYSSITDFSYLFAGYFKLKKIEDLDLSHADDTSYMFSGCSELESVNNLNISNATNTKHMFAGCKSLINIDGLDISNSTDTNCMFCNCQSIEYININTSNSTDTRYMFYGCKSLKRIDAIDTSNSTHIGSMFEECTSLRYLESLNIYKALENYETAKNTMILDELKKENIKDNVFKNCKTLLKEGLPDFALKLEEYNKYVKNSLAHRILSIFK